MNKVFLLGAGASRELRFNISTLDYPKGLKTDKFMEYGPLSSGFFFDSNNLSQLVNKRLPLAAHLGISDNLIEYIYQYHKNKFGKTITKENILNNEEVSRKINIERLYLDIEESIIEADRHKQDNQSIDENIVNLHLIKNDLLEYIYESLSLACYYCYSIYHRILAAYILNYGGDVISFNWDILLDEAMNDTGKWNYEDGYGIKFKDVIYKYKENEDSAYQNKSNNLIFKAHGSINWYSRTSGENGSYLFMPLKRNLRGGAIDTLRVYEYDKDGNQYFTSIVPPDSKREAYSEVWLQIKEVLENADEIIAIGFSFNDNDEHIWKRLQGFNFKKNLKISLVNPDADRLIGIYREIFRTNDISKILNTLGEYCEWIVKQEKMGKLASVLN